MTARISLPPAEELIARHDVGKEPWGQIAADLQISATTLRKHCFPEKRAAYNDVKRAYRPDPALKARSDAARMDRQRDTCIDCGKPRGRTNSRTGPGRCAACRSARSAWRKEQIAEMCEDGLTPSEIAQRLDSTEGSVLVRIVELRKTGRLGRAGGDDTTVEFAARYPSGDVFTARARVIDGDVTIDDHPIGAVMRHVNADGSVQWAAGAPGRTTWLCPPGRNDRVHALAYLAGLHRGLTAEGAAEVRANRIQPVTPSDHVT